ncbi:GerAB/ArcD/ProY family transporter [Selenihalanaerobacter shriftii]|uniref:Spore germination protein KB n=1 Tax=Selenihalanaerobacter shriftii TaxID=142842 RepID=A0A1T4PHS7_9FIRM|nr:endospore germination permease [Selenihalanaerobacter shriftii]SJZ91110.1 spore germination protein KB [Selenihalanaerobacter shriftii]
MVNDIKISKYQLLVLMMGFIFGIIVNPASAAYQDAWLAFIMGWAAGFILIGMYAYIAILNPNKTLIDILRATFGKYLGSILGMLYIWYFIHLAAIILRNFGEFMVISTYTETPLIFIVIILSGAVAYQVRSGLEVLARMSELFVPLVPIFVLFLFLILLPEYDVSNFLPILERGITPVIKAAFSITTFPFGEVVLFLMIFPALNEKDELFKTSYLATAIMGMILFIITIRDLLVLGPNFFANAIFPPVITTSVIPNLNLNLDPVIFVNFLIGGGIKGSLLIYAAALGLAQLFKLDHYKSFIIPLLLVTVGLSQWLYGSIMETLQWSAQIYPYYAIPFQVIIPLIILITSLIKETIQ